NLRVDALRGDRTRAGRVERLLETVPGVFRVSAGARGGDVRIGYDPAALDTPRLVRLAEAATLGPDAWTRSLPEPEPVRFGLANTTLGRAAPRDPALPAL